MRIRQSRTSSTHGETEPDIDEGVARIRMGEGVPQETPSANGMLKETLSATSAATRPPTANIPGTSRRPSKIEAARACERGYLSSRRDEMDHSEGLSSSKEKTRHVSGYTFARSCGENLRAVLFKWPHSINTLSVMPADQHNNDAASSAGVAVRAASKIDAGYAT
ncbi:hypothetical protein SVAN01_04923 [Stagonosporopsis vannaccii]|nr:hypothetical protein SVAN01_04923 [Stagonosporopsis vannaccii]